MSELLVPPLQEVTRAFQEFKKNPAMQKELRRLLKDFAGRPTPLYEAKNLSRQFGYRLFLKREDLLHGGAHKTNNTVGQGLLATFMGKKEIIAETGAGQHGAAVALIGALFNIPVKIFMGTRDMKRQGMNVQRMRQCGAEVIPVSSGSKTLKDAINEAMRYYVAHSKNTYYLFGTAAGPHPFPSMVAYFQKIIGQETHRQILKETKELPSSVIACVGGGSNAIGIFQSFLKDSTVKLFGVEAAGGASLQKGRIGSLHGAISYLLQNRHGQVKESQSIAAGLDYPGVGPQHSFLKETKRVAYVSVTDREALAAFHLLSEREGIIPALESSHAIAYAKKLAGTLPSNASVVVNLSGRGDKDLTNII